MSIQQCPECKRPFSVTLTGSYPFYDREDIICPHCKAVCGNRRVRADIETAALSPEEEARWLARMVTATAPRR
jgi:transcription initiation factor TFIIIB Brf1 subunit/transcription initiation factor TFIIB